MRVKKQKRHRRAVKFYTACFGIRQPYKVLCDGTFVHHLLVNQITPADEALSSILGGPVKLFTTRCVIAELKRLGSGYAESLEAANSLGTATCDHEKVKTADACILEIIGENNSEHFFVGSQDAELRRKLQEVPGVPLIFGLRNSVLLEQPSSFQRQYAKETEEGRLHMTQSEKKMLAKRTKKIIATGDEGLNNGSAEDEAPSDQCPSMQVIPKPRRMSNGLGVKDRVQFKRKKAKGPNPLSCKKKKNSEKPNSVSGKGSNEGDRTVRSRSRKRNRSSKGKETTA